MNSARRFARRLLSPRSRQASRSREFLSRDFLRRGLRAEQLEPRHMMATDIFVSDYWNGANPQDVNADGNVSPLDALMIINELNTTGSRPLSGTTFHGTEPGPEGEGGAGGSFYDVNNDGYLSPLDSLLVINDLNAEGEGELLAYRLYVVNVGTPVTELSGGPPASIASIAKGQDYELVVTIQDLRSGSPLGAAAGFLDVFYDQSLTTVHVNELQDIRITGNPTGGNFRLSFGGQTTAAIPFSAFNQNANITNITQQLEALSNIGVGDVQVTLESGNVFRVRFVNGLGDQDVGDISVFSTAFTGGSSPSATIDQVADGTLSDPAAFEDAFRSRKGYPFNVEGENQAFYNGQPLFNAGNFADRVDDLGGVYLTTTGPYPGVFELELSRVRMNANDAGFVTFTPSLASILSPDHLSLVYTTSAGARADVPPSMILLGPAVTLQITEPVEANPDIVNINEGAGATPFNPIAGVPGGSPANGQDRKNAGAHPTQPLRITAVEGQTSGTINLPSGATVTFSGSTTSPSITYTPPADFNGQDVFEYTISDTVNTDTTTVTVNVAPVNDAPVNRINGVAITGSTAARSATEDIAFNFTGTSTLSISDIDAAAATNIQVNLAVTNGTLTLQSVGGLTFNGGVGTGNGQSSMAFLGSLADINAALATLFYTPTLNHNGTATFTITTDDNGNTGSGGDGIDTDNLTINVAAVNDAPVNMVPGQQSVDENVPGTPDTLIFNTANGNRITVSDVDAAASSIDVNLSVGDGVLTAVATVGVTIIGNGSGSVTLTGSQSNINTALNGLTYLPDEGFTGMESLTVTTDDNGFTGAGGTLMDMDTVLIDVVPIIRPRAKNDPDNPRTEGQGAFDIDVMVNDLAHVGMFDTTLLSVTQPVQTGPLLTSRGTVQIIESDGGTILDGDLTDDRVRYTPPSADFFGTVIFTYTINDTFNVPADGPGPDADSTATVTIVIANVNDQPVANADSIFTVNEDNTLATTLAQSVLNNDTDADNEFDPDNDGDIDIQNTLTAQLVPGSLSPVGGSLTLNPNGTFSYTPPTNFNGVASFQYIANDGQGQANSLSIATTVSITVNAINDKPVGTADSYTVAEEGTLTANGVGANPAGVLANDNDGDPEVVQPLTAVLLGPAPPGAFTLNLDGTFTYTPPTNLNGNVTFQYQANDGQAANALSDPITVTITITPVNDAPVAVDDPYAAIAEDTTLTANGLGGNPAGVLNNDNDGDPEVAQTLTAALVAGSLSPAGGTLTFNTNGTFSYTPPSNYNGPVSFRYTASDGQLVNGTSNEATVSFNVTAVNDAPVASPDSGATFNTTEDTLLTVAAPGVLANDNDGDPELTQSLIAQLVAGSLSPSGSGVLDFETDGSFTFDPADDFSGTVTFQYRANDQQAVNNLSTPTTVTILVGESNDPPTAFDDLFTAIKDFTNQQINVVKGDLPFDSIAPDVGETLTVIGVATTAAGPFGTTAATEMGGTVTIVGGEIVAYDSPLDYEGPDSFFYRIDDGRGGTDDAQVTIDVLAFIPKLISGIVWNDADGDGQIYNGDAYTDTNGNGVYDGNGQYASGTYYGEPFALGVGPRANFYDPPEKRIQGVTVYLTGTDFLDNPVGDITVADGLPVPRFEAVTDVNGQYVFRGDATTQFLGLAPGDYTITQFQPAYLHDGAEVNAVDLDTRGLVDPPIDNQFTLDWDATDFTGDVAGLNFGEAGYNTTPATGGMTVAGGFIQEGLSSSGRNGLVIAVSSIGESIWSWAMPGWDNMSHFELILDLSQPDPEAHATLRVWDKANPTGTPHEIRIHQAPAENGGVGEPPAGSMARFRVLGRGPGGQTIIRLDGTATDFFGPGVLLAAVAGGEAEGEEPVDREYSQAADEVFAEQNWA